MAQRHEETMQNLFVKAVKVTQCDGGKEISEQIRFERKRSQLKSLAWRVLFLDVGLEYLISFNVVSIIFMVDYKMYFCRACINSKGTFINRGENLLLYYF